MVCAFGSSTELCLDCVRSGQLAAFSLRCYDGFVFELDVDGAAGVDGGVVDERVPCVVGVGQVGVVGAVGVGLFDAVALFLSLAVCVSRSLQRWA